MSKYLVAKKKLELTEANNKPKLLVSKRVTEISDSAIPQFSVIKKYSEIKNIVVFDSCGGSFIEDIEVVIGKIYSNLPTPTKTQHIFLGWFTDTNYGQQITNDSIATIDITKLYAQWELVDIDSSNCTSYEVVTTSSYKNTGIYSATIKSSSTPLYIDWGDGSVEKLYSSISQKSHTYSSIGTFTVKISNNITSFQISYNNSTWYGATSQNRYTFNKMISTGSNITSLPSYAFYYCQKMTNIDFMETCFTNVASLPSYCFYYCSGLTSIYGAKRFTSLGSYCFQYCSGLTGIQDLSEFRFTSLPNSYTFANCTNVTQWILPSDFTGTSFGNYTFSNDTKLSTFVLPNSLTSTGTYAFQNCSNLKNIIIPSNVQSIGNYAFYGCISLNNVSIESTNLTAINQYAFYNCNKLVDLDLPDTIKTIGNYAFYGCTNLDYAGNKITYSAKSYIQDGLIAMWDGIENAGYGAHDENASVWKDLVGNSDMYFELSQLPKSKLQWTENSLLYTDEYANAHGPTAKYGFITVSDKNQYFFNGGYKVVELVYKYNNDADNYRCYTIHGWMDNRYGWRTPIFINETNIWFGSGVSYDTIYSDTMTLTSFYRDGIKIKTHTATSKNLSCSVGDSIHILNRGNYDANNKYTYCIRLYNRTLSDEEIQHNHIIDQIRFKETYPENELNNIECHLPSQLTSIGSYAYQGCSNLKSLNIPENLQTIGDYAFAGCYQISSIIDKRLTAQTVSTNTFGSATGTSNTAFTGYQTKGNNILSTYFAATGYDENAWDDPLQNPDKCGFIQQYIDPENIVSCTVTFNAGVGEVSESTRTIVKGKKIGELPTPTVTEEQVYFGGWSTTENDINNIVTKDYKVTSDITLYALYSSTPFANYEVILNDQWRTSSQQNPDITKYDGVYESNSNYNQSSKAAVMYIKIKGYTTFTIYIRSYAESSYDYTVAFNLDTYTPSKPLTTNPSSSTSGVKAHTSGKQNSGTAIGNYTKVEYTGIDRGEHYICIAYRKDSSVNSGNDRGYVLIEKQDIGAFEPAKYITVNFEIGDATLISGERTITDVQGTTISKFPEISAPTDKPYFIGWNTMADGSGEYYDNTAILPNQESLTLYAYYVAEDQVDPNKDIYLCFTAEEANSTISMSATGSAPTVYLETSPTALKGSWLEFTVGSTIITLANAGNKVYFRAKQDNQRFATSTSKYNTFVMTGKIAASGNLNTLLKADGSVIDLTGRTYCYSYMFLDCSSLTQVPELPATTLASNCYYGMFNDCTSLTSAPELPATTLANACYNRMFSGCTSLTQAPELPATTLATECYYYMFHNCTSLIQAPELPATTLADECYSSMFLGCTSLTQTPTLPATTLASDCYYNMFSGCNRLTQAPLILPATTLAHSCYQRMFYSCKSLTNTPALPAMILADYCYNSMFHGCSTLTKAPELPATTLADYCYNSMFWNCTSLTSAPELPATTLAIECYSSMFVNCTSLTSAPELPATTLADTCYYQMFSGCNRLTQAPLILPATTLTYMCYCSMFSNCTALTQAPELPAMTLANNCYQSMFLGCTKLNNINVNFSAWNPTNATSSWVYKVSSSGTFTCPVNLPETYGTSYIPVNWTIKLHYWGLCFTAEEPNSTINIIKGESAPEVSLYTSIDCRTWTAFIPNETSIVLANVGDTVYFKAGESGNVAFASGDNLQDANIFSMSGKIAASGNIMSLLNGETPPTNFTNNWVFANLFYGCSALTKAQIEMPVVSLTDGCYENMFADCNQLTIAPELPATTLAIQCYSSMFAGCTSLTQAPELPAETLAGSCYMNMFNGCTSLTNAPALPATTLANQCYTGMFINCSSLTTSFELPATNLITGCYTNMFANCTSVSSITTNILEWSQTDATDNWLSNVSPTGTFTCYENLPQERGPNRIPNGWIIDNSIIADSNLSSYLCFTAEEPNSTVAIEKVGTAPDVSLKTTVNGIIWQPFTVGETIITLANTGDKVYFKANENDNIQFATSTSIYNKFSMTGKVAASGNIQSLLYKDEILNELPATYCYTGLFRDCSVLTQAPELPVEQLSTYCYGYMFNGCTSLSTPPMLSSTTIANQCYVQMFANCSSLTSAPELPATQLKTTCYSNMFNGCSSLSTPPVLPATLLSSGCYTNMFANCTSLTSTPQFPAENIAVRCYAGMFTNCISLTSMPELPATTLKSGCYMNMFNGCTSISSSTLLPATTLIATCYSNMFNGCSSLTSINVNLSAWNVATGTTNWLSGVADTGIFTCPESLPETYGTSNIPTGWTVIRK